MGRCMLCAALLGGLLGTLVGSPVRADDDTLTIRQVPAEKQREQSARDEGLLPADVPERCADPDVAASDPACAELRGEDADVSESYGIPVIDDPSAENSELLPGVTINQSRGRRSR
jgi:hypothetical protein